MLLGHSNQSSPVQDETVSVQIHRDTSATPKQKLLPSRPVSRTGQSFRPFSRSGSKLSHISVLSSHDLLRPLSRSGSRISHIIPIFEDRRGRSSTAMSETISINSRLFDDNQLRTSLKESYRSASSSASSRNSRQFDDQQSLMNDERSFTVSPSKNDMFKVDKYLNNNNNINNVNNSDVDGSLILETDYYVRQIKQRRNQVTISNFMLYIVF